MTVIDTNDLSQSFINQTRLIIDKIVLHNFKSYAGTEVVGPFHPSFSCIIGPNGSGKSNVIDALLFVFGFRASKMRQGKLSGLIHVSKTHPNLTECSVEIHFVEIDQMNDLMKIKETSFCVKRTAYKNNSSKYFIDHQVVSYKEITDFLKNKNIDLEHRRFLILQGEVEFISQMKPKGNKDNEEGLLEYLEDIVGTTQYKAKIEEYYNKLEDLNEQRIDKMNRLRMCEKVTKGLEVRKQEALNYLEKEKELNIHKYKLYTHKIKEINDKIALKKRDTLNLKEEYKNMSEAFAAYREKNSDTTNEVLLIENRIKELSTKLNVESKRLSQLVKKDIQIQESRNHLKSKIKKIKKLIESEGHKMTALASEMEYMANGKDKENQEIDQLKVQLLNETKILDEISLSLRSKTSELQKEIDLNTAALAPWKDKINRTESNIKLMQSQLDMIHEKDNSGSKEIELINNKLQRLREDKSKLEEFVSSNIEKITQIENTVTEQDMNIHSLNVEKFKEAMNLSKTKHYALLQALNNQNSQSRLIKELMKMKSEGKINGIHGRLGDLGKIDAKYNVAASVACPQLNYIVVETIKDAQTCINFLRENKLGRGVFLCMDQIRDINHKRLQAQIPQHSQRLFSLITPKDPVYLKLFYHVIKDTLVVDDIKIANKVAFGEVRWRVVTLSGQLIDQSGTMSGGGNKPKGSGMSSEFASDESVSEKELLKAEKEKNEYEAKYMQACDNNKQLQEQILRLRTEVETLKTANIKSNLEIKSIIAQLSDLEIQLKNTRNIPRTQSNDKEKQSLIKRLEIHKQELVSYNEEKTSIENIINKYKSKILEMGGTKFRAQTSKVELLQEKLKLIDTTIEKSKLKYIENEKQLQRMSENISELEKEYVEMKSQLEKSNVEVTDNTQEAKSIQNSKNELESQIEDLNEKKQQYNDNIEQLKDKINEFKRFEIEHTNNVKNIELEINKLNGVSKGWSSKLETLLDSFSVETEDFDLSNYELMNENEIRNKEESLDKNKPNINVIEEYKTKEAELKKKQAEFERLDAQKDTVFKEYDDLKTHRLKTFVDAFQIISYKLKEIYQLITGDGLAELEFVDSLDPFTEGIVLSVMPPKKSWKIIAHLSGGEKTLSSLALVFALHQFKPTPIYIMDEIDAALDYKNVSIIAKIIETKKIVSNFDTQFIVVSLRNNMVELSKRFIGIYKLKNVANNDYSTKCVVLNNE